MTINELLALTGLTANDEIPVWDAEAAANTKTKRITAQNLAASIKILASLIASSDLDATPTSGSTKAVQSGGVFDAIQQSTANVIQEITYTTNADFTIAAHSADAIVSIANAGLPTSARILAIYLVTYNQIGTNKLILYKSRWYNTEYISVANPTDGAITVPAEMPMRILYALP